MKLISWYCHSFWISRMRFKLYIVDSMNSRHFQKCVKDSYSVNTWKWAHWWIMSLFRTQWNFCGPPPIVLICHNSFLICDLIEVISKITWVLGRISINGIISWNKSESFHLIDFAVHWEIIRKLKNYLLHAIVASLLNALPLNST